MKGVPLPPSQLPPGMGGSLLIVEITQGFLEEAPVELSLEGWAREGKRERLTERKEWPKQRPGGEVSFLVVPCDHASLLPDRKSVV